MNTPPVKIISSGPMLYIQIAGEPPFVYDPEASKLHDFLKFLADHEPLLDKPETSNKLLIVMIISREVLAPICAAFGFDYEVM